MPKITFIATLPDGSFATRTSDRKVYTFCVAARESEPHARARCSDKGHPDAANYHHYQRLIEAGPGNRYPFDNGRMSYYPASEAAVAQAHDHTDGCPTVESYIAKRLAERLAAHEARVAAGGFREWGVLGWQSRHDLALKVKAQADSNQYYAEAVICAAMPKAGKN